MYFGDPVSSMNPATMQQSMLDFVLDRVLTRPVDWLLAQDQIFSDPAMAKDGVSLTREILNFGPGYGVLKSEARRRPNIKVLDLSYGEKTERGSIPPSSTSDGDIAIVGMAVDLPGAPDTASLWRVLKDEINVVEEVCSGRVSPRAFLTNPHRSQSLDSTSTISTNISITKPVIPKDPWVPGSGISWTIPFDLIIPFSEFPHEKPSQLIRSSESSCRQHTKLWKTQDMYPTRHHLSLETHLAVMLGMPLWTTQII